MKKKRILILSISFLLLFVFAFCYTYFFRNVIDDELYNYGFAKSILDGRVPYVDFNMIIPPIFPYLLAFFLKIFGLNLWVFHILLGLLCVGITFFSYKKIGFRAFSLFFLILIYPFTGYNTFSLFLFMLFLSLDDDKKDICGSIIIGFMFLTKQTLGILIIPSIIFSKCKKKTTCIYIIFVLLLVIYLLVNQSFYGFISYCFLGMFDFASKNSTFNYLLLVDFIGIILLGITYFKTKKREYLYTLCFQIMALPSVNYVHFVISFVPVMYLLLIHFKKSFIGTIFLMTFSITLFVLFSSSFFLVRGGYTYYSYYNYDGFMKNRLVENVTYDYLKSIDSYLDKYNDYDSYIFGNFSYMIKLNLDIPINKFDIINYGNMGIKGYKGYIEEIDSNCKRGKCIFVINDNEAYGNINNQVNREILNYVIKNYYQIHSSNIFSVYITR